MPPSLRTASLMYSVCAQFPFLCLAKNDEEREHKEREKRGEREEEREGGRELG